MKLLNKFGYFENDKTVLTKNLKNLYKVEKLKNNKFLISFRDYVDTYSGGIEVEKNNVNEIK